MHFWGKVNTSGEWHTLQCHCLDVAATAQALLRNDRVLQKRIERCAGSSIEKVEPWLLFFAALHDVGKFGLPFQALQPDLARSLGVPDYVNQSSSRHTHFGRWVFWQSETRFLESLSLPWDLDDLEELFPLAEASFGHHGEPVTDGSSHLGHFNDTLDHAKAFARFVATLCKLDSTPPPLDADMKRLSWLWAGMMVLADWIGSNERWFPFAPREADLENYWRAALERAERAVRSSGVLHPRPQPDRSLARLLPHLEGAPPRPLQEYAFSRAVPGSEPQLHIFEDLTGSGKTEAALLCAHGIMAAGGCSGFYVGLPTMATANAMYERMSASYRALFHPDDAPSLMLSHSARSIHDQFLDSIGLQEQGAPAARAGEEPLDAAAACAAWLADNRKKSLLAACGVGSLDQALLAVLPSRHQSLRMAGLARSVLIADEVHAYDRYTFKLLCRVLSYLAMVGSSAVVLTATLPRRMRQELCDAFALGFGTEPHELQSEAFPLATRVTAGGGEETPIDAASSEPRTVRVDLTPSADAMVSELLAAREAGACACWIRNTVDQAVEAWRWVLDAGVPVEDVTLFHARFAGADRARIEERVLRTFGKLSSPEQRRGKIVIATQVLEQSIDCDFDLLLTDLAPMDLVIQRAGRCCRHERDGRPAGYRTARVVVRSPDPVDESGPDWYGAVLDKAKYVYKEQAVLWRTARLLRDDGSITLPNDARRLLEGAYGELEAPTVLEEADQEAQGKEWANEHLAVRNALTLEAGYGPDASSVGWAADILTPTRLGEPTVQLRLCRVLEDGSLALWAGEDVSLKTCIRSEVRVSEAKATLHQEPDEELRAAAASLMERMPDKGKWSTLLPLRHNAAADAWRGTVVGRNGERRVVEYNLNSGLLIEG